MNIANMVSPGLMIILFSFIGGIFFLYWRKIRDYEQDIILKLRKSENELKNLGQRYSAILESVPDIIVEVDENKHYVWANKAGFAFFGDDMIGKPAEYYFVGEQNVYADIEPMFGGDDSCFYIESMQQRCDGKKRLLSWWCRVLKDENGNVKGAISTARDITDIKQLDDEMKRLSTLAGLTTDIIISFSIDRYITYMNHQAKKVFGVDQKDIRQVKLEDIFSEDDYDRILRDALGIAVKKCVWEGTGRIIDSQGNERYVSQVIITHKDTSGNLKFYSCVMRDISDLFEQYRALQDSEARFRTFTENARDMIYRMNIETGEYEYLNPAAKSVTGYSREQFLEKNLFIREILTENHKNLFDEEWACIQKGIVSPTYEYEIIDPDGNIRQLHQRNVLIRDSKGNALAIEGIVTDLSVLNNGNGVEADN